MCSTSGLLSGMEMGRHEGEHFSVAEHTVGEQQKSITFLFHVEPVQSTTSFDMTWTDME